jgi:monoamine oxidase
VPATTASKPWSRKWGLETCRQYTAGDNLLFLDGKRHRYAGNVPRINPIALVDFALAVKTLEWLAGEVPIDAPGTPPGPTSTTRRPSAPGSSRGGTP